MPKLVMTLGRFCVPLSLEIMLLVVFFFQILGTWLVTLLTG